MAQRLGIRDTVAHGDEEQQMAAKAILVVVRSAGHGRAARYRAGGMDSTAHRRRARAVCVRLRRRHRSGSSRDGWRLERECQGAAAIGASTAARAACEARPRAGINGYGGRGLEASARRGRDREGGRKLALVSGEGYFPPQPHRANPVDEHRLAVDQPVSGPIAAREEPQDR